MTALGYRPKLSGDVEFVGTYGDLKFAGLKIVSLDVWVPEVYVPDSAMPIGRNGRPRNPITMPGHNRGVKPPNTGKRFPPEPLTSEEALRLLNAIPQTTKAGIRNRALLAVLWRTGLRINEALDLRPHHIDFAAQRVKVLNGKGSKTRTIGIDSYGLHELQPWLFERAMLGVPPLAPLFCTIQLPGRGGKMHDAYVRARLHEYGALAGIPKRVHPHGWRHTLAVDLVREGFSIPHVQAQLGHNNIATTATYLRGMGADEAFEKVAGRQWPGGAK